jgi:hypothetical protein
MSTLSSIRSLLENQIDTGTTDLTTDPTSTLLNTYINQSIRKITIKDRPRELYSATVSTANITINTNTVSLPSGIFFPDLIYYKNSSGTVLEIYEKPIKRLIEIEGASRFFDSTNTGDPSYYSVKGTSLLFNKYFSRTSTGAIKIYGMGFPTTLSSDSDSTELPADYDILIVYEAAVLFYQKDDDLTNQLKFERLSEKERGDLRVFLRTNDSGVIDLDPKVFTGNFESAKTSQSVFFGS